MYKVYLGDLLLPVAPSKIEFKYGNKNKTTTLIDFGEINIIKPIGLTEVSFEALLPNQKYPFALYENGFLDAGILLEKIVNMKKSGKPFLFNVIRNMPNGRVLFYTDDFKASIEDLSFTDDAKEGFDINVKIKLKQYIDYNTIIINNNETEGLVDVMSQRAISEEKEKEVPTEGSPKSYTVKDGDTLWAICKKAYGNGDKWEEVAKANGISNPNLIYEGQVIMLD